MHSVAADDFQESSAYLQLHAAMQLMSVYCKKDDYLNFRIVFTQLL